jgi:hypothetical protein
MAATYWDRLGLVFTPSGQNQNPSPPPPAAPESFTVEVGWKRFEVYTTPMSWADALRTCKERSNGELLLATLESEAEASGLNAGIRARAPGLTHHWIGANDQNVESKWYWANGVSVLGDGYQYSNWGANEPNDWGGSEDCAEVYTGDGTWNDANCAQQRPFVCSCEPPCPLPELPGTCLAEPPALPQALQRSAAALYSNKL